jgi:hypothetical protein
MSKKLLHPLVLEGRHLLGRLTEASETPPDYQGTPGPKGQNCENCEFGELFDDDPGPKGWCRLYDVNVQRLAWCSQWTKSSRLDHPKPPVDDDPTPPKADVPAAVAKKKLKF